MNLIFETNKLIIIYGPSFVSRLTEKERKKKICDNLLYVWSMSSAWSFGISHNNNNNNRKKFIFIEGNATMLLHLIPPQGSLKCWNNTNHFILTLFILEIFWVNRRWTFFMLLLPLLLFLLFFLFYYPINR